MPDKSNSYILGIDTSNYTTSVALIDENYRIIEDKRLPVKVKEGMKGIRQSEALFQHMDNLPELLGGILSEYRSKINAVCVSSRPRPVEGSYMPVFKAGVNFGKVISDVLGIPLYFTSHQEGHIEAGLYGTSLYNNNNKTALKDIAAFHLSGGTTELLLHNQIIGGTKDISFGQLLDRMGVAAGFSFPAGSILDKLACDYLAEKNSFDSIRSAALEKFKYIAHEGLFINLSGLDTGIKRILEESDDNEQIGELTACVFYLISQCLKTLTMDLKKQYNINNVIFVGGVSSSVYIREFLKQSIDSNNIKIHFSKPELSVDNAVGIAVIGGKTQWLSNR